MSSSRAVGKKRAAIDSGSGRVEKLPKLEHDPILPSMTNDGIEIVLHDDDHASQHSAHSNAAHDRDVEPNALGLDIGTSDSPTASTLEGSEKSNRDSATEHVKRSVAESAQEPSASSAVGEDALTEGGVKESKGKSVVRNNPFLVDGAEFNYPLDLMKRIKNISDFQAPPSSTFSIMELPGFNKLTWKNVTSALDAPAAILHVQSTQRPLIVWVVGRVTRHFFFKPNGEPQPNVNISVKPLNPRAASRSSDLLRAFTTPRTLIKDYEEIRASRSQLVRRVGEAALTVETFGHFYDASTELLPRLEMLHLAIEDLKRNDLVVLEATVGRYTPKNDKTSKVATFELRSIFLLNSSGHAEDDDNGAPLTHIRL